jgi:hypothetical protein
MRINEIIMEVSRLELEYRIKKIVGDDVFYLADPKTADFSP